MHILSKIILILLLIINLDCFSQSSEPSYTKPIYSEKDSSYIMGENFDTIYSPFNQYQIIRRVVIIPDLVGKADYKLVSNKEKYTLNLGTVYRRDFAAPSFYWVDSLLIYKYETKKYDFINSKIIVFNLNTKKIEFSIIGDISYGEINKLNYIDTLNKILFYFHYDNTINNPKPKLMTLNIENKTIKTIYKFNNYFDFGYPKLEIDKKNRSVKIIFNSDVLIEPDKYNEVLKNRKIKY